MRDKKTPSQEGQSLARASHRRVGDPNGYDLTYRRRARSSLAHNRRAARHKVAWGSRVKSSDTVGMGATRTLRRGQRRVSAWAGIAQKLAGVSGLAGFVVRPYQWANAHRSPIGCWRTVGVSPLVSALAQLACAHRRGFVRPALIFPSGVEQRHLIQLSAAIGGVIPRNASLTKPVG